MYVGGLIHSACDLIVARPLLIYLLEKKQNQALVNLTKIGHFVSYLLYMLAFFLSVFLLTLFFPPI